MAKKKSKIIITILILIIVGLVLFILGDKFIFNNNAEEKKNAAKENNDDTNVENDIYGYLAINKENETKIIELHKKSKNREIASHSGRTYSLTIKNNKLYYYFQNSTSPVFEKAMYIDLKNSNPQAIELITGNDVVDYYFDSNDEYLFAAYQKDGIKKYNLKTKEETILASDKGAYELFIANSKIYVNTYIFDENATYVDIAGQTNYGTNVEKYYTIDFNGNNIEWISKEDFERNGASIGYIIDGTHYSERYFIYNNKKITLSQDRTKLIYDGNVIYSTNDGRVIDLQYTLENEKIGFVEYKYESYSAIDEKYYTIDLKTKELLEVSKNDLYEFLMLLK